MNGLEERIRGGRPGLEVTLRRRSRSSTPA